MNNKVIQPNLSDSDINFLNLPYDPDVEEKVRITIAYLMGQDSTDESFHLVQVDGDGNLNISTASSPNTLLNSGLINVGTTPTSIVTANSSRSNLRVVNNSANNIYLGSSNAVTVATGMLLKPSEDYTFLNYTGALFGIVNAITSELNFTEVS